MSLQSVSNSGSTPVATTEIVTHTPETVAAMTSADWQSELADIDALTLDLKRLIVRHESELSEEGLRSDLEQLERWAISYRRGISAALKLSALGPDWLNRLREKLKLAADELTRMDGEGPNNSADEEDNHSRAEDLMHASRRIEHVIPSLQHLFGTSGETVAAVKDAEPA